MLSSKYCYKIDTIMNLIPNNNNFTGDFFESDKNAHYNSN